jgi:PEP-CTERM motif
MGNTRFTLGVILLAAAPHAFAITGALGCHLTNGGFDAGEWGPGSCTQVTKSNFSPPGAALYAAQGLPGDSTLYLMYDFFGGGSTTAQFFDVFFEVVPKNTDYLVRIQAGGFLPFERPLGTTAPILPNGSFDLSAWSPITPGDPDFQAFHAALGFGLSPDDPTNPHPMAEFQVTISGPGNPDGLYSPDPAFWGASEKSTGGIDPPISSGIFQLNPDGSTDIIPVLGPNGPVMQDTALPEPGTLLAIGSGLVLIALRRRRK